MEDTDDELVKNLGEWLKDSESKVDIVCKTRRLVIDNKDKNIIINNLFNIEDFLRQTCKIINCCLSYHKYKKGFSFKELDLKSTETKEYKIETNTKNSEKLNKSNDNNSVQFPSESLNEKEKKTSIDSQKPPSKIIEGRRPILKLNFAYDNSENELTSITDGYNSINNRPQYSFDYIDYLSKKSNPTEIIDKKENENHSNPKEKKQQTLKEFVIGKQNQDFLRELKLSILQEELKPIDNIEKLSPKVEDIAKNLEEENKENDYPHQSEEKQKDTKDDGIHKDKNNTEETIDKPKRFENSQKSNRSFGDELGDDDDESEEPEEDLIRGGPDEIEEIEEVEEYEDGEGEQNHEINEKKESPSEEALTLGNLILPSQESPAKINPIDTAEKIKEKARKVSELIVIITSDEELYEMLSQLFNKNIVDLLLSEEIDDQTISAITNAVLEIERLKEKDREKELSEETELNK